LLTWFPDGLPCGAQLVCFNMVNFCSDFFQNLSSVQKLMGLPSFMHLPRLYIANV